MPKQKIEIEIDVPDGWEFERYDQAHEGDYVLTDRFDLTSVDRWVGRSSVGTQFIVRPAWKWPEWLKASHIAMDKAGQWYAYLCKPTLDVNCWSNNHMRSTHVCLSTHMFIDFTPPPCDDWRLSLRRNPNIEKENE